MVKMNRTERILRQLISEVLIHDSASTRPINVNESKVYLVERQGVRDVSFGSLIEQRNRGMISEQTALRLWERSVTYELDCILSEGVLDSLKDAYETVKGGALKLKDKISDAAKAAMEKANDFLLKISLQAMNLAQSSVEGIVKAAGMLSSAVERFKDNHPILYKIIKILVIMLIIWGIMSLFSGDAQAAVKMPGGKNMSEAHYNTLRGALGEYGGGDVDKIMNSGEAIKILDKAFKAKEAIPLDKLGSMNRAGSNMISELVNQAKGGDTEAYSLLMKWQKIGQNLSVR
jgi:hypothetical protein